MVKKTSVYQIITDQIIGLLDRGEIPWRKPWVFTNHYSFQTHQPYNGINVIVLDCVASLEGYKSNIWCTFNKASENGGKIKKGESHTKVVKWIFKQDADDDGNNYVAFAFPRYYMVWNADQIEWEDESVLDFLGEDATPNIDTEVDINAVLFDSMGDIEINHGGNSACYYPSSDRIGMPAPERFISDDEYYSTLFHELVHATGHQKRLNRFNTDVSDSMFSKQAYSFEELVAEFGSAFMCARTGIDDVRVLENSAAYIAAWKSRLIENPNWWSTASSKARKATEFIMGDEVVEYQTAN